MDGKFSFQVPGKRRYQLLGRRKLGRRIELGREDRSLVLYMGCWLYSTGNWKVRTVARGRGCVWKEAFGSYPQRGDS